ncbi:hypothetical protein CMMCAS03_01555 [Clavibacter michiganensis subsp. michiganensis]|nr:hypothetical protein [Clavibacter michiganensis]OUD96094.1 hypothetical protein CMMCAS03_01555 [Clavibacter michiganensis subsp. michiganensis]
MSDTHDDRRPDTDDGQARAQADAAAEPAHAAGPYAPQPYPPAA